MQSAGRAVRRVVAHRPRHVRTGSSSSVADIAKSRLKEVDANNKGPASLSDFMDDAGSGCGAGGNPAPIVHADQGPRPDLPTSLEVRSYYRKVLRAARAMPTQHRRSHIQKRARYDFDESVYETDPERIQ